MGHNAKGGKMGKPAVAGNDQIPLLWSKEGRVKAACTYKMAKRS
jgi:hypothetical protein